MVTISASRGATYNMAFLSISMAELFFDTRIKPMVALPFMWAVVILGYGYAAIARQTLIHDPQYSWYQALCQTALFETQKRQRQSPSPVSRRQMTIFFLVLGGVTHWQFLPEFVFPFLQSLFILCLIAPQNKTLNFIGGGLGGMGLLNFSLDWSNISAFGKAGSLFSTPWWTQLIVYLGFVANCWIMLPLAKWGGIGGWSKHLMSNRLYTVNGTSYPVDQIITSQSLNETAYAELCLLYMSTQLRWGMFFDFASYSSAMVWMAIFGYPAIKSAWLKFKDRSSNGRRKPVSEQYPDQLNVLMRNYKEVPLSWFMGLIRSAFLIIMTVVAKTDLYIPWWTVLVAMGTGAVVVVPLSWLYSMSNFQLLLYGLMVNSVNGYKHPIMLQDQKIGHYIIVRWVLKSKFDYISGKLVDPAQQWTGQSLRSALTVGSQYVLLGPIRLFKGDLYKVIPYGFLLGAVTPVILYTLHRFFPRAKFNLWNSTIFYCTLSTWWGNMTSGPTSSIIGGFVVMYWAYRKHYELWAR
ncbi:hypothetical protein HYFRA_00003873 [Hymenoscyphus fraxineus]|uniref:OPT superfamily oligopeptide transporter n=1 Tax=Hymenoscyphus fraxineus TaxID=746836 RepID=A0A9N9L3S1_9HELO|nr:hypothetical protein HYFRA_00003873 [Hymenoscyphus fraxineus]